MDIYLNDLSFRSSKSIDQNWNHIRKFYELVKKLTQYNVNIISTKILWDILLSGYDVKKNECTYGSYVSIERRQFLCEIYKIFNTSDSSDTLFSMQKDMQNPSESVGLAIKNESHVISFAFNALFAQDRINGWSQRGDEAPKESSIWNFYEDKKSNYTHLADLSLCHQKNPLLDPLWNIELSKLILADVDLINQNNKDRQGLLIEYGAKIAEINGWVYDSKVSSLNKNAGQLRYIFNSTSNFTSYKTAYLSIDMEGPDLAFELCDTKGNHKGEVSWDGKKKYSKPRHDIKVR